MSIKDKRATIESYDELTSAEDIILNNDEILRSRGEGLTSRIKRNNVKNIYTLSTSKEFIEYLNNPIHKEVYNNIGFDIQWKSYEDSPPKKVKKLTEYRVKLLLTELSKHSPQSPWIAILSDYLSQKKVDLNNLVQDNVTGNKFTYPVEGYNSWVASSNIGSDPDPLVDPDPTPNRF